MTSVPKGVAADGLERGAPSISALVADLRHETTELFRKEVELARVDLANTFARLRIAASSLAIGAAIVFAGLLFLCAAGAFGLNRVLDAPWLSTLIVAAIGLVVGGVLLALGKARLDHLGPERSLRSLHQDTQLVQDHLPGGGS